MYSKDNAPKMGRPVLDPNDKTIKKTIVLTEGLLKKIKSRIEVHGDLSKYLRYLIRKDLGMD